MRRKKPTMRGSVQQNTTTVRVRSHDSDLSLMARLGIAGGVVLLLVLLLFWGWHSGWFHRQAENFVGNTVHLTQKAHFAVKDIIVEGRQHTDKDQLSLALDTTAGSPIFAFRPSEAEARIAKLSWVESVTVERRLPDTIYVRLVERVPLARWQHDNRVTVIDRLGKILPDADADHFGHLPLVVGAGAPTETKELLDELHSFPPVNEKVTAAVRVSERRWDLHLEGKIVARLPETETRDALKRLSILITEQKILERDIVAIDLRIPDRLIFESSPATVPPHPTTSNRL